MEIIKLIEDTKDGSHDHREQFAMDVLTGFCSNPKFLPAKYFYDDIGSELFQKITTHDDYYLTRTEFEILENIKNELPGLLNEKKIDIIELGAGDGHKSKLIIDGFIKEGVEVNFFPIDISEQAMIQLNENIQETDNLKITGVVAEYMQGLRYVRNISENKELVLFLGSNIGNFDHVQIQTLLRKLWKGLNNEDLVLIGFDLKKDIKKLTNAYNDSEGLTRDFNINLLRRINRDLGANFKLENFQHFGVYNPTKGAMESYLLSTQKQTVHIEELQRDFTFKAYEPIHLEYSFKFLLEELEELSKLTGFSIDKNFLDKKKMFVDSLWRVIKKTKSNK
ncbi:L-histidine N(alpha)-methyltransferase [Bacteriovoracaceae bacterium]|nr:L-histidine N(alpha)-methyltransferase [Bacteriovoracaceae bacterium]